MNFFHQTKRSSHSTHRRRKNHNEYKLCPPATRTPGPHINLWNKLQKWHLCAFLRWTWTLGETELSCPQKCSNFALCTNVSLQSVPLTHLMALAILAVPANRMRPPWMTTTFFQRGVRLELLEAGKSGPKT